MEEPEITTVSEKGQVVIPRGMRERMKLAPKTKLLVYGYDDTLILKKLVLPSVKEQWKEIKKVVAAREKKFGSITEKEIEDEIHAYRREKGLLK